MRVVSFRFKRIIALMIGVALMLPLFCKSTLDVGAIDPFFRMDSSGKEVTLTYSVINSINRECKEKYEYQPFLTDQKNKGLSGGSCYFNKTDYVKLDEDTKRDVMKFTLDSVSGSELSTFSKQRLYNFVCEQDESVASLVRQLSEDVGADFATAYTWFKPFSSTLSTVLGILCIVITAMLGLMIVIDLAYLAIPPFKNALDPADDSKPKFVSNEAYKATKEAEKSETYQSPMKLYVKYKAVQMIILGVCLLYLASGEIYSLVAWIVDTVSGIIG